MEVHHSQHLSHKKKWSEYLLEFLMLFLAVFLGFTAENIREHQIEKQRGKTYVRSLLQDLRQDSSRFDAVITKNETSISNIDTAIWLLNEPVITDSLSQYLYYSHFINPYFQMLTFNQRTISQLRSSGAFRLITSQRVSDSIVIYYDGIENAAWLKEETLTALKNDRETGYNIFNDYLINKYTPSNARNILNEQGRFPLMTNDKNLLISYANKLKMRHDWLISYNGTLKFLQRFCSRIIELIKKEYHIL
jgi:hypothetical protein